MITLHIYSHSYTRIHKYTHTHTHTHVYIQTSCTHTHTLTHTGDTAASTQPTPLLDSTLHRDVQRKRALLAAKQRTEKAQVCYVFMGKTKGIVCVFMGKQCAWAWTQGIHTPCQVQIIIHGTSIVYNRHCVCCSHEYSSSWGAWGPSQGPLHWQRDPVRQNDGTPTILCNLVRGVLIVVCVCVFECLCVCLCVCLFWRV